MLVNLVVSKYSYRETLAHTGAVGYQNIQKAGSSWFIKKLLKITIQVKKNISYLNPTSCSLHLSTIVFIVNHNNEEFLNQSLVNFSEVHNINSLIDFFFLLLEHASTNPQAQNSPGSIRQLICTNLAGLTDRISLYTCLS